LLQRLWRSMTGGPKGIEDPRARRFTEAVSAALAGPLERGQLEALRAWPEAHGVPVEDVELDLERVEGAIAELDLVARVGRDGLPTVHHQHKALGGDRCHHVVSATLVDAEGGRSGRLFVTDRRLVFLASPLVAVAWTGVRGLALEERDLVVVAPSRGTALRLRLGSFADARTVRWLAEHLRRAIQPPQGTS
jgi:hypothetical protein